MKGSIGACILRIIYYELEQLNGKNTTAKNDGVGGGGGPGRRVNINKIHD